MSRRTVSDMAKPCDRDGGEARHFRALSGQMESFDRDYFAPWSSTYFHRRVTHLTALRVVRLGAWSAVMGAHHKGRATTSEGPARPPEGSLFAATGGRRRRLTMWRHRRRDASTPEAAKRRSYVLPSYESKYSARAAWRCLRIGNGAQRRHGAKEPGRRSGETAPRVRRDARPMHHIALRAAPTRGTVLPPSNRFQLAG